MAKTRPLICVVDDDELVREAVTGLIKSLGYRVAAFASAEAFLRSSSRLSRTACLIADVNMPAVSGLDLHQRLSASATPIPTILITAYPDDDARKRALSAGVIGYLSKPFEEDDLLACVHSALTSAGSGRGVGLGGRRQ
jgi:FixJ family two-component response regulator